MTTIARALTRRGNNNKQYRPPDAPYRDGSSSSPSLKRGRTIGKPTISAPMELLSTTNMLALDTGIDLRANPEAARHAAMNGMTQQQHPFKTPPTPPPQSQEEVEASLSSSSSSDETSAKFWDEDEGARPDSPVSPITSPGASLREDSPIEPSPSALFSVKRANSSPIATTMTTSAAAPDIPKRVPSHTKRSHQALSRQRSLLLNGPPRPLNNRPSSSRQQQEHSIAAAVPPPAPAPAPPAPVELEAGHPFGAELEKVREIAEEFGGARVLDDEEEVGLLQKGLVKLSSEDYLAEIEDVFNRFIILDGDAPADDSVISTWV